MKWYENPAELTKRRLEAGLSQAELAKRIGRSRSLIRDVELGKIKLRGELGEQLWNEVGNAKAAIAAKYARMGWVPHLHSLVKGTVSFEPAPDNTEGVRLKEQNRILRELVAAQKELISYLISAADQKDEKILGLEKKVADLRELYDVGTQATVATARYEELREKLLADKQAEDDRTSLHSKPALTE